MWQKAVVNWKYFRGIYLEALRKTTKIRSQVSRFPGQTSNRHRPCNHLAQYAYTIVLYEMLEEYINSAKLSTCELAYL
jgi:hypothetical protein